MTISTLQISPAGIRSSVEKEDDFGHEMRVGGVVREIPAIQVQHGGTYTDPATQKPRQFDYRCWLTKEASRLLLAVECKNISPSIALVVCGTKRQKNEAFHDLVEARNGSFRRKKTIINGRSSVTRRATGADSIYPAGDFVGKSVVRVSCDNGHKLLRERGQGFDVYDRWAQALASSVELVRSARVPNSVSSDTSLWGVLPIVVVPDGVLWKVAYTESGTISSDPSQVDEVAFFVGREIETGGEKGTPMFHRFTFSHVHFLTLGGFRSFLNKMAINEHAWSQLFTTDAVEL